MDDLINNPPHYKQGKYEPIDVIEDWGLDRDFCLANVIKYIARSDHKGNKLQDLKKAQFYLNRKIENLERNSASRIVLPLGDVWK